MKSTRKKPTPKIISGTLISVWTGRVIQTPCKLNLKSGELFPDSMNTYGNLGNPIREYFEDVNEEEYEVCSTCHEFILKIAMNPGIGHDLNEEEECSNPECESHE